MDLGHQNRLQSPLYSAGATLMVLVAATYVLNEQTSAMHDRLNQSPPSLSWISPKLQPPYPAGASAEEDAEADESRPMTRSTQAQDAGCRVLDAGGSVVTGLLAMSTAGGLAEMINPEGLASEEGVNGRGLV